MVKIFCQSQDLQHFGSSCGNLGEPKPFFFDGWGIAVLHKNGHSQMEAVQRFGFSLHVTCADSISGSSSTAKIDNSFTVFRNLVQVSARVFFCHAVISLNQDVLVLEEHLGGFSKRGVSLSFVYIAVGQIQWYHFGVGEFTTHFRTYFSGWIESDGLLTHGHMPLFWGRTAPCRL